MFAKGVEFLAEDGAFGVGVRFRERKLEYTKNVKVSRFDGRATMQMRYAGTPFTCVIPLETVDDFSPRDCENDDEFAAAIGNMLHRIIAAVERRVKAGIENESIIVTSDMLNT